ncbi:YciI family protein [Mycobacterium ostraviense]|uniref:YciI family protein n=1 Tax=Mycobacterium ostraviense TaxID=2738409 RepID=UPI001E42A8CB|nr:YciI family protein [Mycobacterium ostraviense]UGT93962.1 YciI family protein [Mycobacterium ostraviense]
MPTHALSGGRRDRAERGRHGPRAGGVCQVCRRPRRRGRADRNPGAAARRRVHHLHRAQRCPADSGRTVADTKERLGGVFVIEVPDLDAALAWARRCPATEWGSVEIRPVAVTYTRGKGWYQPE